MAPLLLQRWAVVAPLLLLFHLLLPLQLSLPVLVGGQSYVPQVPPLSSCPGGQRLVTVGYVDATNRTLFPYNDEGSLLFGNYAMVYVTPFTLRGASAFGTMLYQVSLALLDNTRLLRPTRLRIGVYLFQEAEKKINSFNEASLVAQTDEITLYPSRDQTLYANLLQPVLLDSEGDYGLGIYAESGIYVAGGLFGSGFSGESQFYQFNQGFFNDYSAPQGTLLYNGDRRRPVAGYGCLDSSVFNQPNQTDYAFCALVETYIRQPANNTSPLIASETNITRYTGVIAVNNATSVTTAFGTGYPIVFMEGEVQVSTNAGATDYPPHGLRAIPFTYRLAHPDFAAATDLLYPNASIPLDRFGVVITTPKNQTNLFFTNVSIDSTIGQRTKYGTTNTYFSSFKVFPRADLEQVITDCNVPLGYDYVPDSFACDPTAAPVQFGDIDLQDLNPLAGSEFYDYLRANLISFRFFTVYTPDTTAYQLTYFSYSNPEAIVHMRLGLFITNTSYVDSFSALPEWTLLGYTNEVELVNVDDTLVVANLTQPVRLTQGLTYAIGVWTDCIVYGPQARWGVNAAGYPLPYNAVSQDGNFPQSMYALGGQTGTQPMGVNACAARQQLLTFQWCATFADYFEVFGQWFLDRRFYEGTFWGLSTPYTNQWGQYHILVAGNGTFYETVTPVAPPPPFPPLDAHGYTSSSSSSSGRPRLTQPGRNSTATWNLNNFQVQSPDFLYVSSPTGLHFDEAGLQIVMHIDGENFQSVYAVLLQAVRPRGSPVWFYQESIEFDYSDSYLPLFNSGVDMRVVNGATDPAPQCPLLNVPWDLISPGDYPFVVVCNGLAEVQSTYGDNRVYDYPNDAEGNVVRGGVLYTVNFTATAGTTLWQVSIDVLNNTGLDEWVRASIGIYSGDGRLLTQSNSIYFLQVLDQMVVADLLTPVVIDTPGLYYVGVVLSGDYNIATSQLVGPSMTWSNSGLPSKLAFDGVSPLLPITVYGCVQATHYLCGSTQFYLGDDYSPVTIDYLYQGLIVKQPFGPYENDYGTWQPILYAVGHLSVFTRIARYAANFRAQVTDILLSRPGNASSDSINYFYVQSKNGASLDGVGITFITDDDFGYSFTISYNASTGRYVDSTNAQLGTELLQTWTLAPIDLSMGVPQCSFLDLEAVIAPNSTLTNSSTCPEGAQAIVWGDVEADDYFYSGEGLYSSQFSLITLSPINTGPVNSSVSQVALALGQNGNSVAHIRMAIYDLQDTLLAESEEVTVDNPQDVVLYFTLNTTVLLRPNSIYYIAYWTDVSLYTAAGADFNALCYYGLQYGYDLQPWPPSVGSKEAEYTNCRPLPVAALGCVVAVGPPPPPPECPNCADCPPPPVCPPGGETQEEGVSVGAVVGIVMVAVLLTALLTVLALRMYQQGKCPRVLGGSEDGRGGRLMADEAPATGGRFSQLVD